MITLFHSPRTRSSRFIFLLEELGAPYEIHYVGIQRGDGSGGRDDANPHPHGKVPAIADDGEVVFESSAIALYLTDKFPQNRIGPQVGERGRGAYLTWLAYYCGVLEPAWMMKFAQVEMPKTMPGWPPVDDAMAHVTQALVKGPYLLGDQFSAADILVGTTFALFMGSPMLPETPLLRAYVDRITGRPAYARAGAKEEKE
jgi:glutathione S-transferase